MKKISLLILSFILVTSCSDSFLDSDLNNIVTDDTIAKLSEESPEALLDLAKSFDLGTINNMRSFEVAKTTWHSDYGQKSIDIMMDLMSNDMIDSNNG